MTAARANPETGEIVAGGGELVALPVDRAGGLLRLVGSVDDIVDAARQYHELCRALLDDADHQDIAGKRFRKKSAWRKLATAYGVTLTIVERTIVYDDDDGVVRRAEFVARAIAPNGRYVDGWGLCDRYERCCPPDCTRQGRSHRHCPAASGDRCAGWTHFSHANHDVPSTAETRAKNRAASDLFGMGEESAEEVTAGGGQAGSALPRGWADQAECDAAHEELASRLGELNAEGEAAARDWLASRNAPWPMTKVMARRFAEHLGTLAAARTDQGDESPGGGAADDEAPF